MASLLPNIPARFMDPSMKYALINWLVDAALPSRVTRQVLQQWGEHLLVDISSGDYALLNNHLRTVPVPAREL